MPAGRCVRRKAGISDLFARFSGINPVSPPTTTPPPATVTPIAPFINATTAHTTSVNPPIGNRTFFNDSSTPPSSPSSTTGSYHAWPGTTSVNPLLRTLGGFPYDLRGAGVQHYQPTSSVWSSNSDEDEAESDCCCGLKSLLPSFFRPSRHPNNPPAAPIPPPSPTLPIPTSTTISQRLSSHPIDYELVLIHHNSLNTTLSEFLAWFFAFHDVRGRGIGRLRLRDVWGEDVAGELEGGGLWVVGDEGGVVAGSVAGVLRGLGG